MTCPLKIVDTEPLIKRAIILYCKANFGLDNKDSEKYQAAYNNLTERLSLSLLYKDVSECGKMLFYSAAGASHC